MSTWKKNVKKIIKKITRLLPGNIKRLITDIFATLSGTREMRDQFNAGYGEFMLQQRLLEKNSDETEYHVDKIIRSIGNQLAELREQNETLAQQINELKKANKK